MMILGKTLDGKRIRATVQCATVPHATVQANSHVVAKLGRDSCLFGFYKTDCNRLQITKQTFLKRRHASLRQAPPETRNGSHGARNDLIHPYAYGADVRAVHSVFFAHPVGSVCDCFACLASASLSWSSLSLEISLERPRSSYSVLFSFFLRLSFHHRKNLPADCDIRIKKHCAYGKFHRGLDPLPPARTLMILMNEFSFSCLMMGWDSILHHGRIL